jgi:hypothetical protein
VNPVVRIPDDVFERLQSMAVPLVDSVGDVIRRLLDEREGKESAPRTTVRSNESRSTQEPGVNAPSLSDAVHPDFTKAPRESQRLHDAVRNLLTDEFDAEVRVDQRTLVFRSEGKNFAAIQRVGLREPALDLSIFGERTAFEDPRGLVVKGRFPHWAKIRIDPHTDLKEVSKILRQSHSIRMRRGARS